jgi:CheY-like chemotaxis protein
MLIKLPAVPVTGKALQTQAFQRVPPAGFEPAPPPPEGGALSPELRGPKTTHGSSGLGCTSVRRVSWPASPRPRPRVLVVDDDPMIRRLITVNLELEGFEVTQADDGQSCLDAILQVQPHVVVLDVAMPQLDGLATAVRLRADPAMSGIKILMVSARAQQTDIRRGLAAGVDVYITKPFDPDALIRAVQQLAQASAADGYKSDGSKSDGSKSDGSKSDGGEPASP